MAAAGGGAGAADRAGAGGRGGADEMARIRGAAAAVRALGASPPSVGVVLGAGRSELARAIEVEAAAEYADLPHFPAPAADRPGRLLLGRLGGAQVAAMQGRFHRYDGCSLQSVVFPVRVMRQLGARVLIASAGGDRVSPLLAPGDLMLIADHINFMGASPLTGPNLDELGPRFPDMSAPYDADLRRIAAAAALEQRVPLREGVYAAVTGPQRATRAERRMLRGMGADAVGMSTVPEVIAARHAGMRVLGFAVITDPRRPDSPQAARGGELKGGELKAAWGPAGSRLVRLVIRILERHAAAAEARPLAGDAPPGSPGS